MPTTNSGQNGSNPSQGIYSVLPEPKWRAFIVGTNRSGKSTLAGALLEAYHYRYPRHIIYIVDPKSRFICVERDEDDEGADKLFPDGLRETNHGKRDGVTVHADYLTKPHAVSENESAVFVVQDESIQTDLFRWAFKNSDVRRPTLFFMDESFDLQKSTRADPAFRKLLQMGGEVGVGAWIINQRPKWIDSTFITESRYLFIGRLAKLDDRKALADSITDDRLGREALVPSKRFWWLYIDQDEETSKRFTLKQEALGGRQTDTDSRGGNGSSGRGERSGQRAGDR